MGSAKSMKAKTTKMGKQNRATVSKFWPDVTDDMLWRSTSAGFAQLPRTMPLIQAIMDVCAKKGAPVSACYLALCCRDWGQSLVRITAPRDLAMESHFTGQRSESTWNLRMRQLRDLGFIRACGGPSGEFSFVLLMNPYRVIEKLSQKAGLIPQELYTAFYTRAQDVGARDLEVIVDSGEVEESSDFSEPPESKAHSTAVSL